MPGPGQTQEASDKPRVPHVIRGAEGRPTPDDRRPVEQVAHDHALKAWGELRGRDKLDSTGAVRLLQETLLGFLGGVTGKAIPAGFTMAQANGLDVTGRPRPTGKQKRVKQASELEVDDV